MHRVLALTVLLGIIWSAAGASDTDWGWNLNSGYFGTLMGSSDNSDARDSLFVANSNNGGLGIGTYHSAATDGWSGPDGLYSRDFRAPMELLAGRSKIWTFYLWDDPASSRHEILLNLQPLVYDRPPLDKMLFTLKYVRAPLGGGLYPVQMSLGESVSLGHGNYIWSFPVYKTTDGRTGYMFEFTATVIPEPSSLLAILAGLGGLGAMVRRRLV